MGLLNAEADLVNVEGPGTLDVRDGDSDELESEDHAALLIGDNLTWASIHLENTTSSIPGRRQRACSASGRRAVSTWSTTIVGMSAGIGRWATKRR
jgi:hypothetical protein